MSKYKYEGPVTSFGRVLAWEWRGETVAESTAKAKSNLAFQFKKANNLLRGARIELPGKIMVSSI